MSRSAPGLAAALLAASPAAGARADGLVTRPIAGKLSDGRDALGQIVIDLAADRGQFIMVSKDGHLFCIGDYRVSQSQPVFATDFGCGGGITGSVIAQSDETGLAGQAVAVFSNGLSGQFAFGDDAVR
ncbi:MAG: hypothetical protein KDK10_18155 [Maritimibacter sp.]|nr:hypothetical protein [Maritimibacter sp.]